MNQQITATVKKIAFTTLLIKETTYYLSLSFVLFLKKIGIDNQDQIVISVQDGRHCIDYKHDHKICTTTYAVYQYEDDNLFICRDNLNKYFNTIPKKLYISRL